MWVAVRMAKNTISDAYRDLLQNDYMTPCRPAKLINNEYMYVVQFASAT